MSASAPDVATEVGTSKAAARIRAAAIEVFAAKGYGATTTREIAASLDLSPGAVYPHYKTKESLLFAISLEGHYSALSAITKADQPTALPVDRLTSTVAAYVEWHARNHSLARVVQHELRSLSPEHFQAIAAIRRSTSKVFTHIIEAGDASGDFRTIDTEAATLAITSLGVDVSRWFPSNTHSDPAILAQRYVELSLRMVGAQGV
ncbi:TetR/AcrR family transcriptional regulator [Rhodococcus wratislaviensis]|uniref:Putative TetR family transcriptional regulator n=1 Tax=Rhodococcus wratislaviensis NBRC 100605 TaxID=1219028 RepID=X0Q1K7_RHOWR|nr:TetR/AcrR family transcriptional regulator [Rhodococcus wratislaviensis]GAF44111.1 putative TetR family transcriptional regulator [Rhodococcus wratislaviensis NBRC 100605]